MSDVLKKRPLSIVTPCRVRDLPVLKLAIDRLQAMDWYQKMYVVTPEKDCKNIQKALGKDVFVISEDEFVPRMNIKVLRSLKLPGFPKMAGWYLQQFIKLQYAFINTEDDYYLIWEADNIPLRPMVFFDSEGKMLLTKGNEYHKPYFETYKRILGVEPNREYSFIAQHMVIQKSIAREMLENIEKYVEGNENWAWKIMRSLPEDYGLQLFCEYETYGHYVKRYYPERVRFINREWFREMPTFVGRPIPTKKLLEIYAKKYDYVNIERAYKTLPRIFRIIYNMLFKKR